MKTAFLSLSDNDKRPEIAPHDKRKEYEKFIEVFSSELSLPDGAGYKKIAEERIKHWRIATIAATFLTISDIEKRPDIEPLKKLEAYEKFVQEFSSDFSLPEAAEYQKKAEERIRYWTSAVIATIRTPTSTSTKTPSGISVPTIVLGTGVAVGIGGGVYLLTRPDGESTPLPPFSIVEPVSGATVAQRNGLVVRGVGMKAQVREFHCNVFTDKWYPQTNAYHRNDDGTWETWITLSGQGVFNNHTIRVEVTYTDNSYDTAEVSGIRVND